MRLKLKSLLPFPVGKFSWFMVALQLYYLYEVFVTNDTGGLPFTLTAIFSVVWSLITVFLAFQIILNLSAKSWVVLALSGVALAIYTISAAYTFGANDSLDWALLAENLDIAWSIESLDVLLHSLDAKALQYGVIIAIVFSFLQIRYKTVTMRMPASVSNIKRLFLVAIYAMLILIPIEAMDPLLNFLRSGYFYYRNAQDLNIELPPNTYPFLRSFQPTAGNPTQKKPAYIFLIAVESLNADVIHKNSPSGQPLTPFLNELKTNSVFVHPFYGNSIQTAKGHFALLFSTIPSLKGKAFVKYPAVKMQSIASVLHDNGYHTVAFSAHENPDFDNARNFFTQHGYKIYETVQPYLTPDDAQHRLRWGVKDDVFFKRFFDYFDRQSKRGPTFYTLITIANHFPFNSMSPKDRLIVPNPQSLQDHYANSIHLVDQGIQTFYSELKKRGLYENSLVIITADHAFPMGAHGNYHLEAGYHEDSFRIPFFMTWPSMLTPEIIQHAGSQMDVPITILDALSISVSNTNLSGQSLLSRSPRPIYLVQPYAKHFSVIRYPYKYRFFAKTEQEFVYNLHDDPLETTSIKNGISSEQLTQFRKDMKRMYLSQSALASDQVWRAEL
jgi:arylsulfatase A-like enzyme